MALMQGITRPKSKTSGNTINTAGVEPLPILPPAGGGIGTGGPGWVPPTPSTVPGQTNIIPPPPGGLPPTLLPPQPITTWPGYGAPTTTQPGIGQGFLAPANGPDIRGLWNLLATDSRGGFRSTTQSPPPDHGLWGGPGTPPTHGGGVPPLVQSSQPNLGPLPGTALASQQGTALSTGFGQQTPTTARGNIGLPTIKSSADLYGLMPKKPAARGGTTRWTF